MIIFGWRSKGEPAWSGLLRCDQCRKWCIHYGVRLKRYFELFFIPLIPLWSDTKTVCSECLHEVKLGPADFADAQELARGYYDLALLAEKDPARYQEVLAEMQERGSLPEGRRAEQRQQEGKCITCGAVRDEADEFCISCGERL